MRAFPQFGAAGRLSRRRHVPRTPGQAGPGEARLVATLRSIVLPFACAAFVAFAFAAVAVETVPPTGLEVDAAGRVTAVARDSQAWIVGVQPGWQRGGATGGVVWYADGHGELRPIFTVPPDPLAELAPAFVALGLAGVTLLLRFRRLGTTLAVASTVPCVAAVSGSGGPIGLGLSLLPVALGGFFAERSLTALPIRPARGVRVAALLVAPFALFVAGSVAGGPSVAVAAATCGYLGLVWIGYFSWRASVASARVGERHGGRRPRRAVVREVVFEALPFADRARRSAAEAERNRLASDLHAGVLPAIASTAAVLEQRGEADAAEQLRELAVEVREMMSDRRLPILDDEGLVAAAEWLAESLEARAPLRIEIDLAGDSGLRAPVNVEHAAYRVLQLALDNVVKHAGATLATVAIATSGRSLRLSVADDGGGIPADAPARAMRIGHLGLVDMRSEAEAVGASLAIERRAGNGTQVTFTWPA